jgi:hypothetical protein
VLINPTCLNDCRAKLKSPEAFYSLPHQEIWKGLCKLADSKKNIDLITANEWLRDKKLLDQIGGPFYLSTLANDVPSAANIGNWLNIIAEKYELRRIVQTCTEVVGRIYEHSGDAEDLLFATRSDLHSIISGSQAHDDAVSTIEQIDAYNIENDPNCLIGKRYLCRGGGLVIVGPSGVGKSSLIMQFACAWAVGWPMFGIKPARPLNILIVQAENDDGDMKEMLQGVCRGIKLDEFSQDYDLLKANLLFRRDATQTADGFIRSLSRLISENQPDLVVLDPAVSFIGDDISKQSACSNFFRRGLNSIAADTGCSFVIVNHTTKPPTDSKSRKGWQSSDWQYAGAGSYDIVGWARAVMNLREVAPQTFALKLTKRGPRAGALNPDETPTTDLWLKHATDGIYWHQVEPPEEPDPKEKFAGGKPNVTKDIAASNLFSFCSACMPDGEGLNNIAKRLENWLAKQDKDVSKNSCKRIIPMLVANGKLAKGDDGLYRKGAQA